MGGSLSCRCTTLGIWFLWISHKMPLPWSTPSLREEPSIRSELNSTTIPDSTQYGTKIALNVGQANPFRRQGIDGINNIITSK